MDEAADNPGAVVGADLDGAPSPVPDEATGSYVVGRMLVQFKPGVDPGRAARVIAAHGARQVDEIPQLGVKILELPSIGNEHGEKAAFHKHSEIEFAALDQICQPADVYPNDPKYFGQWHLPRIGAPTAWSTTTGSSSIVIAICDTGIDSTHPDLASQLVPGWNVYANSSFTADELGHGTGVAGIAAAASNNSIGIAAVTWGCRLMPVRVSDANGVSTSSIIANGITWAADHGARLVNVSYGVNNDPMIGAAAQYLQSKGGVLTISAGNSGTYYASSTDDAWALAVGATDASDAIATFSASGNYVDLCAPGVSLSTTGLGGTYVYATGTSFSAPLVAGVAALVLSVNPALTGTQVQDILKQSADDLGPAGWDPQYGWGRVNAANAVALAAGGSAPPPDTTPPTVSFATPVGGSTVSGNVTVNVNAADNVSVASVALSIDGAPLATDTMAPYSFAWDTTAASNAAHTLTAVATDSAGNTASAVISVVVSNAPPADTTPPIVTFAAPMAGSTISGTVTVNVSASDNVGVASVTLSIDGTVLAADTASPYVFSWNSTAAVNGPHTLTAVAADGAGNTAGAAVAVTVSNSSTPADTLAPTISIVSPTSGSVVSGVVSVQVRASDNVGVTKVELYVDGKQVASSTTAPFLTSWNAKKARRGTHALQTKAYDAAGNVGISSPTSVTR